MATQFSPDDTRQYIGRRISMLTDVDIRYEGTLCNLNPAAGTISILNVTNFGTEDRKTAKQVPKQKSIAGLVVFRGSNVKEILVLDQTITAQELAGIVSNCRQAPVVNWNWNLSQLQQQQQLPYIVPRPIIGPTVPASSIPGSGVHGINPNLAVADFSLTKPFGYVTNNQGYLPLPPGPPRNYFQIPTTSTQLEPARPQQCVPTGYGYGHGQDHMNNLPNNLPNAMEYRQGGIGWPDQASRLQPNFYAGGRSYYQHQRPFTRGTHLVYRNQNFNHRRGGNHPNNEQETLNRDGPPPFDFEKAQKELVQALAKLSASVEKTAGKSGVEKKDKEALTL